MTSSPSSRRIVVAAAATIAIFLAVLVLLGVRMAGGHDPALGAGAAQPASTSLTQAQAPVVEDQQPYETYDDDQGYAESYGDDGSYGDQSGGTTVQPQAPMQSGTS